MKALLEVVKFNVSDIVTASGCALPEVPTEAGGNLVVCDGAFAG